MNLISKFLLVLVLFIVSWIHHYLFDSYVSMPISTFVLCIILIADYIFSLIQIKKGNYILIGKSLKSITSRTAGITSGILMIIWGVLNSNKAVVSYQEVNSIILVGIIICVSSLTIISNFTVLVKSKQIVINSGFGQNEWYYTKINKITINKTNIECIYKSHTLDVDLTAEIIISLIEQKDKLNTILGDKLTIK